MKGTPRREFRPGDKVPPDAFLRIRCTACRQVFAAFGSELNGEVLCPSCGAKLGEFRSGVRIA